MLRQFYLIAKKPNVIKNYRVLVSEINAMSLKEAASNLLGVHHSFVLSHGFALQVLLYVPVLYLHARLSPMH